MIDAQLPGNWQETEASFIAANAAQAKILCDVTPPRVMAAVGSEGPLPGESSVRQRIFTGGQRIIDGSISSTDGTARSILLYIASLFTSQAGMGVATITGTNAFNRTVGSFITDGWQAGDGVIPFGMTTAANNGVLGIVTAVAAGALTVNGTPYTNETLPAGARLFRVSQKTQRAIPINAGNADTTPPVQLLGGAQDPAAFPAPDTGLSLSANGALIVAMKAAVSALPAQVSFNAVSVLY